MGFFSKKNNKKQKETLGAIGAEYRDQLNMAMMERCIPVAKAALKIILDKNLSIGDSVIPRGIDGEMEKLNEGNRPAEYQDAAKEIQELMLKHKLLWMERHVVFMLMKQPIDMLQNIVLTDLETTYQRGLCKLFGIEVFGELSFEMIDEFLKSRADIASQELPESFGATKLE